MPVTGAYTTLNVEVTDSVFDVMQQLKLKGIAHINELELRYCGIPLSENSKLSDYSIPENSTLHLMLCNRVTIMIRALNGDTLTLNPETRNNIYHIKWGIQDLWGIDTDAQRLIFENRVLGDKETVEELGLTKNSSLYLIIEE